MNVLFDSWIPVRRQDGSIRHISPAGVTADYETNPATAVASPRPDFDGALTEFLIAVFQTLVLGDTERDRKEWRRLPDEPLGPEVIAERLRAYRPYFELTGSEHRFLQDQDLLAETPSKKETGGIEALLIDAPGENALRQNTDHFVHRNRVDRLCERCTAAALMTLQLYAPSGGVGHRTGLRGGGPLSTLIRGQTLWLTIVWNLIPRNSFLALAGNLGATQLHERFPWMGPTRRSAKDGVETTAEDVHPDQQFWAMPRRIRLLDSSDGRPGAGPCDVCGERSGPFYDQFVTRNYGTNYEGAWRHPLTPYYRGSSDEVRLPRHPRFRKLFCDLPF